jgi:hypothetical protein
MESSASHRLTGSAWHKSHVDQRSPQPISATVPCCAELRDTMSWILKFLQLFLLFLRGGTLGLKNWRTECQGLAHLEPPPLPGSTGTKNETLLLSIMIFPEVIFSRLYNDFFPENRQINSTKNNILGTL